MSDKLENLKSYIRELVIEIEDELDESTATGDISGYQTPNAFGDDSKQSKKKIKDVATQSGYTVVNEGIKSSEVKKTISNLIKLTKDKSFLSIKNVFSKSYTETTDIIMIEYSYDREYSSMGSNTKWFNIQFQKEDRDAVIKLLTPILKKYNRKVPKLLDESDPCWKNYKQIGTKQKNGKDVPNCVPKNESILKEYEYAPPKKDILRNTNGIMSLIGSNGIRFILKPETKVFQNGGTWIFTDGKSDMWLNYRKPVSVVKKLGRAGNTTKNLYNNAMDSKRYNEDSIPGGLSDNKTLEDIVNHHKNESMTKDEFIKRLINTTIVDAKSGQGRISIDGFMYFVQKKGDKSITKNDIISVAKKLPNITLKSGVMSVKESIKRTNRWLELKNDETNPNEKLAMGLKELKYKLREVESFIRWYNKIGKMNELDSDSYWKRTNKHIYKIKERLINIARTIQELEK